jgi:hypothetical protein
MGYKKQLFAASCDEKMNEQWSHAKSTFYKIIFFKPQPQ